MSHDAGGEKTSSFSTEMQPRQATVCGQTQSKTQDKQKPECRFVSAADFGLEKPGKQSQSNPDLVAMDKLLLYH